MSNLFGINIPSVLRTAIKAAGGLQAGTLTKVTHGSPNTSDYAAGKPRTLTNHPFEGFVDDREALLQSGIADQRDSAVFMGFRRVTILGASLPAGIVPRPNDTISIGGKSYVIANDGVKTDPVEAVFTCYVRGGA